MAAEDHSIAGEVRRALQDAQELVRSEIALAKAELRQELRRLARGVAALAAAVVLGVVALVFLLTALAWGIAAWLDWPAWAGFALVTAVVMVAAAGCAVVGRRGVAAGPRMPLTMDVFKENVRWMRRRLS